MNTTLLDLERLSRKQTVDNYKKRNRASYLSDSEGDLYDDFCMIDDIYVTRGN